MFLLLPISERLTLCRQYLRDRPLEPGDLVPLRPDGAMGQVRRVSAFGVVVFVPADLRDPKPFLAAGWRKYRPEPPVVITLHCVPGGERYTIAWALSHKFAELPSGESFPAVCLRAWNHDRYPGVVLAEFRRTASTGPS